MLEILKPGQVSREQVPGSVSGLSAALSVPTEAHSGYRDIHTGPWVQTQAVPTSGQQVESGFRSDLSASK